MIPSWPGGVAAKSAKGAAGVGLADVGAFLLLPLLLPLLLLPGGGPGVVRVAGLWLLPLPCTTYRNPSMVNVFPEPVETKGKSLP